MCFFDMLAPAGRAMSYKRDVPNSKISAAVTTSVQDDRVPQQDARSGRSSGGDEESSVLWSQLDSSCAAECYTLLSIST